MTSESKPTSGTTGSERSQLPDYWAFVETAQRRIAAELPGADLGANRVFLSLNRASSTVTYDFESSIHRPNGLTWSGFRLLLVLWVTGGLPPLQAARISGMSKAAVSSLVNTLVGKDLVERAASEHDGRSVTLRLTPHGSSTLRTALKAQNEREAQWAGVLSKTEQETLSNLLEKVMSQRQIINASERR